VVKTFDAGDVVKTFDAGQGSGAGGVLNVFFGINHGIRDCGAIVADDFGPATVPRTPVSSPPLMKDSLCDNLGDAPHRVWQNNDN